ncbi:MAG: tRNA-dihydrouridine synthase family protein [Verrucomicrobiales bacterium]|nr:tRNA-dihydrouridine synthase family protein [Verrucomicrobiales bacterium]
MDLRKQSLTTPLLALAPMQEVTGLPFWSVIHNHGDPDLYFTEYIRVHVDSRPQKERQILRAISENPTGKPAAIQMIGRDIPALIRTADYLQRFPGISAIDLNLGCPSPTVCSKNAGGGLLRNPTEIDAILTALRDTITETNFTVKTRVGFDSPDEFDRLLDVFAKHPIDLLSVHGRTVREKYATAVHHDKIAQAVRTLSCPVLANGNVVSVRTAELTLAETGAAGLMVGRGVIRNPFLFAQIKAHLTETSHPQPTLRDIHHYIHQLRRALHIGGVSDTINVSALKRYLNFIGQGINAGEFIYEAKRALTSNDLDRILDTHLLDDSPFPDEPPHDNPIFAGLVT